MGGYRAAAPGGEAASPPIYAVKDPLRGNLDRVQVGKGWLGGVGVAHRQEFDAIWSGERRPGAEGRVPAVGSTVDVKTARYANTIGAAQLAVVWKDPQFDPKVRAFYYVRVIEIPTPRQSLYDAVALGIDPSETR